MSLSSLRRAARHHDVVGAHRDILDRFVMLAQASAIASFDVFDTLLVRSLGRPADLFEVLARQFASSYPSIADGFAARRVAAESAARDRARANGRREVALADIYAEMANLMPSNATMPWNDVMRAECDLEVASVSADPQVVKAFLALRSRMPCVLVSDMYLPSACIRAMLDRCGIDRGVRLFVSSELGVTKHDGSIWDVVRASLGLAVGDAIAHLDDNPVVAAAASGRADLSVRLLVRPQDRQSAGLGRPLGSGLLHDACHALLSHDLVRHRDDLSIDPYWLAVAHLVVVPAVLGLASHVARVARDRGTDRVFFLARDGLIVRTAYEAVWRDGDARPSEYVWASRRCLNVAMIDAMGDPDLAFLCSGSTRISVADYLRRVDLDPADPAIAAAVSDRFPATSHVVTTDADRAALRGMFEAIADQVRDRAATERGPLLRHLSDVGLYEGPGVVVDLGWHGTLQRSLVEIGDRFAGGSDLEGAYLGLFPSRLREASGRPLVAHGWLFDGESAATDVIRLSVDVVELLFSAPEGGIRHVGIDGGVPFPVRISEAEEAPRLEVAALFHDVVARSSAALRPLALSLSPDEFRSGALKALEGFLSLPSRQDVDTFRRIPHAEGFGVARYRPLIPPVPLGRGRWAIDQARNESSWPAGYVAGMDPRSRFRLRLVSLERRVRRAIGV